MMVSFFYTVSVLSKLNDRMRLIFGFNLNSITQILPGVSSCQWFFIYLFLKVFEWSAIYLNFKNRKDFPVSVCINNSDSVRLFRLSGIVEASSLAPVEMREQKHWKETCSGGV